MVGPTPNSSSDSVANPAVGALRSSPLPQDVNVNCELLAKSARICRVPTLTPNGYGLTQIGGIFNRKEDRRFDVTGWVLVGFFFGLMALIIAVPPMLSWSNEMLAFTAGLVMAVAAIAWLFVPVPKPDPHVDCGTVVKPKSEWTGEPLDFGSGPGGVDLRTTPDFHRQCADKRSSAIQQAVVLGLVAAGVIVVYGSRERRKTQGN